MNLHKNLQQILQGEHFSFFYVRIAGRWFVVQLTGRCEAPRQRKVISLLCINLCGKRVIVQDRVIVHL